MKISRRKLLVRGAQAGMLCLSSTELLKLAASAADLGSTAPAKTLVVIWLNGGNDGLNMVVPTPMVLTIQPDRVSPLSRVRLSSSTTKLISIPI